MQIHDANTKNGYINAENVAGCKYLAYAIMAAASENAIARIASIFLVRGAIGFLYSF